MKRALEVRLVEAIRKGKGRLFTRPLSALYALGVHIRHALYDGGWLKQNQAPLPVVSIGNLVAGGAGKTQAALLLAKEFKDVAVLSRGYRSHDEPKLLAGRLPEAKILVGKDRYKSCLEAKKLGARLVLLDDGMQHRRLGRDFEIVVLNGNDPFGGGYYLPRGLLREDPRRLSRADLILFVGKPSQWDEQKVKDLTTAPCVGAEVRVNSFFLCNGKKLETVKGKKVGLFCGIAQPHRFAATVEEEGAKVVASHHLPDHAQIGKKELHVFAALCKQEGAEYLFCTEKDWVKLPKEVKTALPIGWVQVELEIVRNREAWERMKEEISLRAGR